MPVSTLIQVFAACSGVLGSLFFGIGIMRQSVDTIAQLASTKWDWNPHMAGALAAQKADYLFGGGIICLSFGLQLLSFFVSRTAVAVPARCAAG